MIFKLYRNINTNEEVWEDDWERYALEHYNANITPKGANGEYTIEQLELIEVITEWFFSDNWILEDFEDDDVMDLEEELEKADRIYQDSLDKKWGIA